MNDLELFRAYFKYTGFPSTGIMKQASYHKNEDTAFIGDLTYPDHSLVNIGQRFEKQWKIQNVGKTIWENRQLICIDDQLSVHSTRNNSDIIHGLTPEYYSLPVPNIKPSEQWTISINFIAPDYPCTVISNWKMIDHEGNFCFPQSQPLTCLVKVIAL